MANPPRALCFGSIHRDLTYHVPRIVSDGETVRASDRTVGWGGKGLNQAVALAAAGVDTRLLARTGSDTGSPVEFLRPRSVNVDLVEVDEAEPTGHAVVQLDSAGSNCIIVYPGANRTHTMPMIERSIREFNGGDLFLAQNETNLVARAIAAAKEHAMCVAYNPSPLDGESTAINLDDVDYLFVNEHEAMQLAGAASWREALLELSSRHADTGIVLTLGAAGSLYRDRSGTSQVEARRVKVADTTGAGDTFTGFFLASVLRGLSPHKALSIATDAAAIAVARPGAAESIPQWNEVERRQA